MRVTPAQRAWLEYTASINNRTQAAEIRQLLQESMERDSLRVYVHECKFKGRDRYYSVSIGKFERDFFETPVRELAMEAAKDKAQAVGLGRDAIVFDIQTDEPGEAA